MKKLYNFIKKIRLKQVNKKYPIIKNMIYIDPYIYVVNGTRIRRFRKDDRDVWKHLNKLIITDKNQ